MGKGGVRHLGDDEVLPPGEEGYVRRVGNPDEIAEGVDRGAEIPDVRNRVRRVEERLLALHQIGPDLAELDGSLRGGGRPHGQKGREGERAM
jgi:hypothetical protein